VFDQDPQSEWIKLNMKIVHGGGGELRMHTMANFTTITSEDCETFTTLIKAIATLTDHLKAKDIWTNSKEA
jgi:hypothetical protein